MSADISTPKLYLETHIFQPTISIVGGVEVVRTGGLFGQPNIALSYLYSAHLLLQQPDHVYCKVARTIAYLQRHALEVGIKNLIQVAHAVHMQQVWLAALKSDPAIAAPFQPSAERIHGLRNLKKSAINALALLGYQLPDEISQVADCLSEVDHDSSDSLRYSRSLNGKPYFAEAKDIPLRKHQDQLEAAFQDHLTIRSAGDPDAPYNMYEELSAIDNDQCGDLYQLGKF